MRMHTRMRLSDANLKPRPNAHASDSERAPGPVLPNRDGTCQCQCATGSLGLGESFFLAE